jgi:hypothetical protein
MLPKYLKMLVEGDFTSYSLRNMASPTLTQTPTVAMRRGKQLIVPRGSSLPAQCIKCGASAVKPWKKKFYWHTPWLYLMILFPGLLIYAIVAVVVRKQMELNVPLCDTHHADRKRNHLLTAIMLIGFIPVGTIVGMSFSEPLGWMTGTGMFLAGLVFWSMAGLGIRPAKIDEIGGEFKGACTAFLDLLPEQR